MSLVQDRELVLFHYRDGLAPERVTEIEDALFYDAELRLRLAALRETLAVAAEAWPAPASDASLEQRLWSRLQPELAPRRDRTPLLQRLRRWLEPLRSAPVAFASLLLAALGIGYLVGQWHAPAAPVAQAPLLRENASQRMLAAYLATHLEDTERALLVAQNSPQDGDAAQRIASELIDSNRLYALAAERAGKPALASFLRELEPVLIELSNEDGAVAPALGDEIRDRDLAYKTRAAAALARRDFAPTTPSI